MGGTPGSRLRQPPEPIALSILTGFLGAGKTTILNAVLRDSAFSDALVIVNEFGSIGIDHHLVERVEGETFLISSGCLCCSVRGDLVAALEDALRARDNGRIAPFTRVVIETTGLAEPAPIIRSVMAHPYLRLRFRLAAVVAVVDAELGEATLERFSEARHQVALADRVLISKTDCVGQPSRSLLARLYSLNTTATLIDAAADHWTPTHLFEEFATDAERVSERIGVDGPRSPEADHHTHLARLSTCCLQHAGPTSIAMIEQFCEQMLARFGAGILRYKGLVAVDDEPTRPLVVQGAQHARSPFVRLPAWPSGEQQTRIVVITEDTNPRAIEDLWAALMNVPVVDGADASALVGNPLTRQPEGLLR